MSEDQAKYGNDWERTVIGNEPIDGEKFAREIARYKWASERIKPGDKVLEFGCSSGFALRFLPEGIDYTGVDYSKEIIKYAKDHFDGEGRQFIWSTIDKFIGGLKQKYDVIIAFEVLEHVHNGRQVAQELKKHCSTLLISCPYREPVGFWGKHHVLHGLHEKDFPQFDYRYMHINGAIETYPTVEIANLMLMEWKEGQTYKERKRILCAIPTSRRYDCLLQTLQSVAFQTVKPDKVNIYDDTPEGERADLRAHVIGQYIFPLLNRHGIEWEVIFTPGRGQHIAHEMSNTAGYDFVWRLDDDHVAEPDVLERLLSFMQDDVGAVGGAVYELRRQIAGSGGWENKIDHFFDGVNVQWAPNQGIHEVDFLYSSFLYRAGVVHYKHNMSPVAFHEETIFSHRLKRAGYRLIVDTSIHTHHFKAPHGGTRHIDYEWAYAWDLAEFLKVMANEFSIKLIHLGVGLGDCLAFRNILPELKARYRTVVVGTVYPEVFEGIPGVVISPYDKVLANSRENVYDFMAERRWTGSIVDAYREMYK